MKVEPIKIINFEKMDAEEFEKFQTELEAGSNTSKKGSDGWEDFLKDQRATS